MKVRGFFREISPCRSRLVLNTTAQLHSMRDSIKPTVLRPSVHRLAVPLFLIILLPFASPPTSAQGDVQVGVKAGGTVMTSVGDPARPVEGWRWGITAGGVATADVVGPFAAQLELNYVQKGAQILIRGPADGFAAETRTLDYIEIPFLAKIQAPIGFSFSPSLFAGPTLGILVNGEDTRRLSIGPTRGATETGVTVGGDVEIRLDAKSNTAVTLDVRYTFGLTEYNDLLVGQLDNQQGTFQNQGVMVTLGLDFDLRPTGGTPR